jgi:hypothetical protein
MILGIIFALMGAQVIAVGFCAKVFSYADRSNCTGRDD